MALGGRLVEEFRLREDTLGQWIAHHLAEKLTAHKNTAGTARASLEAELVDIILKFWKHRAYLPHGIRPFEGYDAVLRALESLDPEQENSRYFQYQAADELAKSAKEPSQAWIDAAKVFDRGARAVVRFCFKQAARASKKPDEAWLSAAKVLAEETDIDISVIRLITKGTTEPDKEIDRSEFETKRLKKVQEDLLRLINSGSIVLKLINDRLEDLAAQTGEPKSKASRHPSGKPDSKRQVTKATKAKSPRQKKSPKPSKRRAPLRK